MKTPSFSIANSIVQDIYNKTTQQMRLKDKIKQMPMNMQVSIHEVNHQILSSYNLPKPNVRKERQMCEDIMPKRYLQQKFIQSKIAVFKSRDDYLCKTGNNFYEGYRGRSSASRYASTPELDHVKKNLKVQFVNGIHPNNIIKIEQRGSTAKSFRSVIELEQQISKLRMTYLKMERQKKKQMQLLQPQTKSKKKLSKDYTFDYNSSIIDKNVENKRNNIRSLLKPKSISLNKVTKKIKNQVNKLEEKNIEEQLLRMNTGYKQKQLRVFSNFDRRQISHIPYIELSSNTKLFQNLNILHGPNSPTSEISIKKQQFQSGFKSYFQNNPQIMPVSQLITEDAEEVSFPLNKQIKMKNINDGQINKNSKYFTRMSLNKSSLTSSKDVSLDYKPVNSPKRSALDNYYNLRAVED